MADDLRTHEFSGNYPIFQGRDVNFQVMKDFFWGKWGKFNTPKQRPVDAQNMPTAVRNTPIVMQYELKKKSGDIIEIPIHRQLKALPRIGSAQLEGHEEKPKVNVMNVPVIQWREAEVPQYTAMQSQVLSEKMLIDNARPALQQHFARSQEYLQFTYAMYHGFDYNTLNADWFINETKVSAVSHPHIYTSGGGKVAYSGGYPGTSGYETAAGTDVTNVGAGDVFDTSFLSGLASDPQVRKIKKIVMKDGTAFWLLVAHPWQVRSLVNDSAFREVVSRGYAGQMVKDNPILTGCRYIYEDFAIFQSDTAVWPVRTAAGVPQFGPATVTDLDSFEDYSSDTKFAAMVLGDNALYKAIGKDFQFRRSSRDYGDFIGVAYRVIEGVGRPDFWNRDDGTTGQYLLNDSSCLAITYATQPGF